MISESCNKNSIKCEERKADGRCHMSCTKIKKASQLKNLRQDQWWRLEMNNVLDSWFGTCSHTCYRRCTLCNGKYFSFYIEKPRVKSFAQNNEFGGLSRNYFLAVISMPCTKMMKMLVEISGS